MRAEDTKMFDSKGLPVFDSPFENVSLPNEEKSLPTDKPPVPLGASSMAVFLDEALSAKSHPTEAIPVVPENRAEARDKEEGFCALDIENLFPDDFGSGSGVPCEIKLPMLSPEADDIGSFFVDNDVKAMGNATQAQQVSRIRELAAQHGHKTTSGLRPTSPSIRQFRNEPPHVQDPTLPRPNTRQIGEKICDVQDPHNKRNTGQMNASQPHVTSAPATQGLLNGIDGGPKPARTNVFKVPKVPSRRIKHRPSHTMTSAERLKKNPATSAMLTSYESADFGAFLASSPTPPTLDNLLKSTAPSDAEAANLDVLLGIRSDCGNEHSHSIADQEHRLRSRLPSLSRSEQLPSCAPATCCLDETPSLFVEYHQAGVNMADLSPSFISPLFDRFPDGQIRSEGDLELQRKLHSEASQPLHRSSSLFPEESSQVETFAGIESNIHDRLYIPSTPDGPSDPHQMIRNVSKRKRLPVNYGSNNQKSRRIHAGADLPMNGGQQKNNYSSVEPTRFGNMQLQHKWHCNEIGSALHGEDRHRVRKKKRTRVEDLDPSEVHVCSFEDCRKKFAKKYNLKIHERRHRGDLPFICSRCAKKFMWQSSFERHLRVHESRVDGLSKRTRKGKRSDSAAQLAGSNMYAVVRISDETTELALSGIKTSVNHGDPASLALALSLCMLNYVPEKELRGTFFRRDAEMGEGSDPIEEAVEEDNGNDEGLMEDGQVPGEDMHGGDPDEEMDV